MLFKISDQKKYKNESLNKGVKNYPHPFPMFFPLISRVIFRSGQSKKLHIHLSTKR